MAQVESDRLTELAMERADLLRRLDEIEDEMSHELSGRAAPARAPTPKRQPPARTAPTRRQPVPAPRSAPTARQERQHTDDEDDDRQGRGPSLKSIIQGILRESDRGLELKEIVAEVTKMIDRGKYSTKAGKVTPIVSQALHQLKQEQAVHVEKSEVNNRSLYSLPA